mmetsp:Transcript_20960/g.45867  ORF Transcript_20960/g.45867 Transcript_20960/m.45867 type:complete len:212 (-) Transcript_20960:1680-2315(-)
MLNRTAACSQHAQDGPDLRRGVLDSTAAPLLQVATGGVVQGAVDHLVRLNQGAGHARHSVSTGAGSLNPEKLRQCIGAGHQHKEGAHRLANARQGQRRVRGGDSQGGGCVPASSLTAAHLPTSPTGCCPLCQVALVQPQPLNHLRQAAAGKQAANLSSNQCRYMALHHICKVPHAGRGTAAATQCVHHTGQAVDQVDPVRCGVQACYFINT